MNTYTCIMNKTIYIDTNYTLWASPFSILCPKKRCSAFNSATSLPFAARSFLLSFPVSKAACRGKHDGLSHDDDLSMIYHPFTMKRWDNDG